METLVGSASEAFIAHVLTELDALTSPEAVMDRALFTDAQRVSLAEAGLTALGRVTGLVQTLIVEADRAGSPQVAAGVGTLSWLHDSHRLTRSEAGALVRQGHDLVALPRLCDAVLAGEATPAQARSVSRVLAKLPADLPDATLREAEAMMVGYCAQFDSTELGRLTRHLLEVIAPEVAEEETARRLERELATARANRHLSFVPDGFGSTLIRGSLLTAEAELLRAQIDAIAHQHHRRALDCADPLAEKPTPGQRRADALVELAHAASRHQAAPRLGGDRPRLMLLIEHQRLLTDCRDAHLLDSGTHLTATQLRQLACDAGILPAVLGGNGEVLDVGREHRLVTPPIRAALTARDRGCVFPGCDRPAAACDAHHVIPWYRGGPTALNNLVLLCRHHHNTVEPDHRDPHSRWQVRIDDEMPVVIPPVRVDPRQRPRRNLRHHRETRRVDPADADSPSVTLPAPGNA